MTELALELLLLTFAGVALATIADIKLQELESGRHRADTPTKETVR